MECRLHETRVLDHAVAPIRGNDAEACSFCVRYVIFMRKIHRTRMKGGYLVVGQIGCNECLRGKYTRNAAYMSLHKVQAR